MRGLKTEIFPRFFNIFEHEAYDVQRLALRWRKMAARWPQDGPKMAQDGPKMAQDAPKMAQDRPKMAQDAKMSVSPRREHH